MLLMALEYGLVLIGTGGGDGTTCHGKDWRVSIVLAANNLGWHSLIIH